MQEAVLKVLRLGKLPTYRDPPEYWRQYEIEFDKIEKPISLEEAVMLLECFHDSEEDDWEGAAQTLMHIIESSGFRFKSQPDFKNEWHKWMWERQNRG